MDDLLIPDAEDFDFLYVSAMPWSRYMHSVTDGGWSVQITDGRFRTRDKSQISQDKQVAYWFENYTALILARAFLAKQGYSFQILFDEADMGEGVDVPFMLITDYGIDKFPPVK